MAFDFILDVAKTKKNHQFWSVRLQKRINFFFFFFLGGGGGSKNYSNRANNAAEINLQYPVIGGVIKLTIFFISYKKICVIYTYWEVLNEHQLITYFCWNLEKNVAFYGLK